MVLMTYSLPMASIAIGLATYWMVTKLWYPYSRYERRAHACHAGGGSQLLLVDFNHATTDLSP